MSIFVATKPLSRHSRESGNPVLNLVRSTQSIDLTSNDKDPGFPPKARGNDAHAEGAL